ncbi:MAG: hypothetical protein ACOVMP_08920 [Chthoniobacterales bacterium]
MSTDPNEAPIQPASPEAIAKLDSLTVEIARLQELLRSAKAAASSGSEVELEYLENELAELQKQLHALSSTGAVGPETASEVLSELEALNRATIASEQKLKELKALAQEADQRVAELEKRLQAAQAEKLAEQSKTNELFLIPERSGTTKSPLLLDVTRNSIQLHTLDGKKPATAGTEGSELSAMLAGYEKTEYYIVAYFRPSTFHLSNQVTGQLRELGYEIGFDVLTDEQVINFREGKP